LTTSRDETTRVLIEVAEAQSFVHQWLTRLSPVEAPLADALGCVASESVDAREAVPGFDNSAMDGYAVRSSDTTDGAVRLSVPEAVLAGDVASAALAPGEAMRIMTGAPLPVGADAVCMIEEATVDADGAHVVVPRPMGRGENVRRAGDDVVVGDRLVDAGVVIGAGLVGVLAGQGLALVSVYARPRVGVLSTGHELATDAGALRPGQIRDSNRPMLLALLRRSGFEPVDLGTVEDDAREIEGRFREGAATCDAVVSTGGVSVGDADHVKHVLTALCGERSRTMRVAVRPGKPFAFGVTRDEGVPLFGLAGNPVSTMVGYELFVRPALRRRAGFTDVERPRVTAVLDVPLERQKDGKLQIVFATAGVHHDGRVHVTSVARAGSHLLNAVASANACVPVPDGPGFAAGEVVPVMVLDADALFANGRADTDTAAPT